MRSYLSAYELAVANGFVGTQEDFVNAILRGEHNAMSGRAKEDAHPISSITGLAELLATIESDVEAVRAVAESAATAASAAEAALASAIATTEETAQDIECYDGEAYTGETSGDTENEGSDGEVSVEGGEVT